MEPIRRRFNFVAKLLCIIAALSACKSRITSNLQDASALSTHYWSEGEYYFRGECSEGQAPSRSCKNNLSSLKKSEIAAVQIRLGQIDKEKVLLKELGLESVASEADKLQVEYSSKIKFLSDIADPDVSREVESKEEKKFIERIFSGRAALLDIKNLIILRSLICTAISDDILCRSPEDLKKEGFRRQVTPGGYVRVQHFKGRSPESFLLALIDPKTFYDYAENVVGIKMAGLLCLTFKYDHSNLQLGCQGSIRTEMYKKYSLTQTLAQARKSLKVAVGSEHLCSVADESALFCEGSNYGGQLGTGDQESRRQKVAALNDVIDVAAGLAHSCAVQKGGVLRCWGRNEEGQLGHAYPVIKATDEKAVVMHGVRKVFASYNNTCAILENRELYCWGEIPTEFVAGALHSANEVNTAVVKTNFIHKDVLDVAMSHRNICAFIEKDGLKCWGNNIDGLLDTEDKFYGDQPGETLDKIPAVFKYEGTPN